MACVLQIGAGGVGGVVAHKMAKNRDVFTRIILASRTIDKCKKIAESIKEKGLGEIEIESVDADNVDDLIVLINKYKPKLVINVALPYQDLSIMEACLQTHTHYLDTANYEHPDSAHFEYKEQWAYDSRYKEAGIFALLGSGFDPGVTNVFCAYAQKHYFDTIESIDILDCNAGDHGYAFATNFNPEINLREVSSKARYWVSERDLSFSDSSLGRFYGSSSASHCNARISASHSPQTSQPEKSPQNTRIAEVKGENVANVDSHVSDDVSLESNLKLNPDLQEDSIYRKFEREEKHWTEEVCNKLNTQKLENVPYCGGEWRDVAPLALMKEWDYTEVGVKNSYLLYHEELESLVRNIRGLRKIRFFMTFGESYLTHMKVLENVGLLRIDEVLHKDKKIVPIEVLKTLLPDPASLASRTKGKTHIGCFIRGYKDGKLRTIYIYNICDHEECYKEVNAQGVSYTTGVPAMIGAKLIVEGKWGVGRAKNVSFMQSLQELDSGLCGSTTRLVSAPESTQPANLTQNTHSLDSMVVESFNAVRVALNKDMPRGGEGQGVDGYVVESAEAFLGEFAGCQGGGEGSLLNINDQAATADSRKGVVQSRCDKPKPAKKATQGAGVWNMEQNDPDPFMAELNKQGLPYVVLEVESPNAYKVLEDGRKYI